MCSPTCGLERPLRLIRLILSLDHRRTSHWLDWQSLAAAAAVVAAAVVLCYNVLWETLCAAPKVQILWEGHKIWKKTHAFFWNYLVTSKQSGRLFFQIFVAFWEYLNFICHSPNLLCTIHTTDTVNQKEKESLFLYAQFPPIFVQSSLLWKKYVCWETVTDFTEIIIEMVKCIWDDKDFQVEFSVFSASHSHSS